MTAATLILETIAPDAVKNMHAALPSKDDVYERGVDPTHETPDDKNAVWFVLHNVHVGLGAKLRQRMTDKLTVSRLQWYWAVKIAGESLQPKEAPVEIDMTQTKAFFDNAISTNLRNPSVHLMPGGVSVVIIKRVGNRTRNKANIGTLVVTDDGKYPDNRFYGRIGHDGMFRRTRKCNAAVTAAVQDFAADPAGVATSYGKLTGNCCFCRKALTDPRSTDVGYGKTCAGHWSLPWG